MVSNEKSLTEENSNLASDDAFSSEVVRENNSKQNEEIVSGKKAERKKASKVTAEAVQVEKPDAASAKKAVGKASPKKTNETKAETIEPKPAKVRKAAVKKTEDKGETTSETKLKTKRQPTAKKQLPGEELAVSKSDAVIINPIPEQQQITGEHSITILPNVEPEKQEITISDPDEQQLANNIQDETSAQAEFPPSPEQAIEAYAEEQLQAHTSLKSQKTLKKPGKQKKQF
jgi:hypothetical protein